MHVRVRSSLCEAISLRLAGLSLNDMGSAHSRGVRGRDERAQDQDNRIPSVSIPARRDREDAGEHVSSEHSDRRLRRRRLSLGLRSRHLDQEEDMAVDGAPASRTENLSRRIQAGWNRTPLSSLSRRSQSSVSPGPMAAATSPEYEAGTGSAPSVASNTSNPFGRRNSSLSSESSSSRLSRMPDNDMNTPDSNTTTPSNPWEAERASTFRMLERAFGSLPTSSAPSQSRAQPHAHAQPHPRIDPSSLPGTFGQRNARSTNLGPNADRPSSALTSVLAELLSAPREGAPMPMTAPLSGTSVIVQGALIARTASQQDSGEHNLPRTSSSSSTRSAPTPLSAEHAESPGPLPSSTSTSANEPTPTQPTADASSSQSQSGSQNESNIPHVATLEEQGEMLGRILRIAAAATAASVVNQTPLNPSVAASATAFASSAMQQPSSGSDAQPPANDPSIASEPSRTAGTGLGPSSESNSAEGRSPETSRAPDSEVAHDNQSTSSSGAPQEAGFARELLNRLISARGGAPRQSSLQRNDSEAASSISRLLRDALRASLPQRSAPSSSSSAESDQTTMASVLSTLERARQNQPLPDGEPGSFDRFLRDLLDDLNVAIHQLSASGTTTASTEQDPSNSAHVDEETRERRESDVLSGQLAFFRMFRFERNAESALVPCVMVGVRSLRAEERLMGGEQALPRDGADNRSGVARFVLFVSGGRYHENHPLLSARPRDAGRDLMFIMELLGTIAAMSNKRPTASAADIERSGLAKVRASELVHLRAAGRITENTSDKCLVCLDDWQDEDECRILSCKHVFHASCVDQWLEHSSNSCPLCTYESCFLRDVILTNPDRPDRSCVNDRSRKCRALDGQKISLQKLKFFREFFESSI